MFKRPRGDVHEVSVGETYVTRGDLGNTNTVTWQREDDTSDERTSSFKHMAEPDIHHCALKRRSLP